jgi:hypothetical protein
MERVWIKCNNTLTEKYEGKSPHGNIGIDGKITRTLILKKQDDRLE